MRLNRTSAHRPPPVSAPGRAPARTSATPARPAPAGSAFAGLPRAVLAPAGLPAGRALPVPAVSGLPVLPTWRSALDSIWAALADEGTEGVELTRAGPRSASPASVGPSWPRRHPERDADEQARIAALVALA